MTFSGLVFAQHVLVHINLTGFCGILPRNDNLRKVKAFLEPFVCGVLISISIIKKN